MNQSHCKRTDLPALKSFPLAPAQALSRALKAGLQGLGQLRQRIRTLWYGGRLGALGKGSVINPGVRFQYPGRICLGSGVGISSFAVLRANTSGEQVIRIGERSSVQDAAILSSNGGSIHIGRDCWVGPQCLLYGNGDIRIGDNVLIAAQSAINTVSHHADRCDIPISEQGVYCAPVVIEDDVWIGMGATVLQGITIGRGAIIGAGSVLTRDVPAWSIVTGIPGRVVGRRENAPPEVTTSDEERTS